MLIYSNRSQNGKLYLKIPFNQFRLSPYPKKEFKIVAINSTELASTDAIRKAQRSKNEVIKTGSYDNSHIECFSKTSAAAK